MTSWSSYAFRLGSTVDRMRPNCKPVNSADFRNEALAAAFSVPWRLRLRKQLRLRLRELLQLRLRRRPLSGSGGHDACEDSAGRGAGGE